MWLADVRVSNDIFVYWDADERNVHYRRGRYPRAMPLFYYVSIYSQHIKPPT
jgi:hypothetical protein